MSTRSMPTVRNTTSWPTTIAPPEKWPPTSSARATNGHSTPPACVTLNPVCLDLAVYRESQLGRTVYLDFLRNPLPASDGSAFDLNDLDEDVHGYLANNEALQDLPIDRLLQMNPLAIELYKMHGTDLTKQPLPFNVNNQHMNGGVSVDIWNHTSLPGCYAVGEVAGTHGVTRPGGAALNGGQVGGMRAARHIHEQGLAQPVSLDDHALAEVAGTVAEAQRALASASHQVAAVREDIQARMSDKAGFLCQIEEVPGALSEAEACASNWSPKASPPLAPANWPEVFRWQHLALASEAVLAALDHYVAQGGGSRGARAYLSADKGTVKSKPFMAQSKA